MKRPCFALTLLLGSLAGSLLAVGSAKCQTGLDPAPSANWFGETCPLAPSESSGSLGLGYDEDARWQAHQAEESQEHSRNYDEPTPAETTTPEPTPAQDAPEYQYAAPAYSEPTPASPVPPEQVPSPETESDYSYRNDYDTGYDYESYRPEPTPAPVEEIPAASDQAPATDTDELDPYWTQDEEVKPEAELDPYWTQDEVVKPEAELDPYWTNNDEPAPAESSVESESNVVDPEWAKDAVESVDAWIEKLNVHEDSKQDETEIPAAPVEPQTDPAVEKPADNDDQTYGAHLWDDCELNNHCPRSCEYPLPKVSGYDAEPAPAVEHVVSPAEKRQLMLHVAHTLNELGVVFQTASQNLVRIANESGVEQGPATPEAYELQD